VKKGLETNLSIAIYIIAAAIIILLILIFWKEMSEGLLSNIKPRVIP